MKRSVLLLISVLILTSSAFGAIIGDIDNSGKIELQDAVLGLQVTAGLRNTAGLSYTGSIGLTEVIYDLKMLAGIIPEIFDPPLRPEEEEFLANTPESVDDITEFILPGDVSARSVRSNTCNSGNGVDTCDPATEGQKRCLIKKSLCMADYLVKRSNFDKPAGKDASGKDDPNQPKQYGLAYSYGQRDYTKREAPPAPKPPSSKCNKMVFGLDCSGFVYHLLLAAGLDVSEYDYNLKRYVLYADRERQVNFLNGVLKKNPIYSMLTAKDMGQIPSGEFQSGDIIYWKRIRCPVYEEGDDIPDGKEVGDSVGLGSTECPRNLSPTSTASHIGMIFKKKDGTIKIFQSNGISSPENGNCDTNYGTGRGPREIPVGGPYYFDEAVYGIVRFEEQGGCTQGGTNSLGMTFVSIPAGTFIMGSPENELQRHSGETMHQVTLTKSFCIQTTEVTQGQWKTVMGKNPSYFSACGDNCPVDAVSWNDAQEFITKMNQSGEGTYRLPTEAEWEYAARARSTTALANGDISLESINTVIDSWGTHLIDPNLDAMGWYWDNCNVYYSPAYGKRGTHPVKQKQPNAWGLYDMHGNVQEWVQDWYAIYTTDAVIDPMGPNTGSSRVYRGGSWIDSSKSCRSAQRGAIYPGFQGGASGASGIGFRLVREQ